MHGLGRRSGHGKRRSSLRRELPKAHGHLHVRLYSGVDFDAFQAAPAQLWGLGLECVFARRKRRKTICAITAGCGAKFRAGSLVAEDEGDTGQRGRMQVSESAGKRSHGRGMDDDHPMRRLGEQRHNRAREQHDYRERPSPAPPSLNHGNIQPAADAGKSQGIPHQTAGLLVQRSGFTRNRSHSDPAERKSRSAPRSGTLPTPPIAPQIALQGVW